MARKSLYKKENLRHYRKHRIPRHNNSKSEFDISVDRLLKKNNEKLKKINKYPYLPYRTDGERVIAQALGRMKIRYVPEYVIENLKGDTKKFRISDFYLPKEKIHIEFLGNWNSKVDHVKRYKHKMAIYYNNNLKTVWIWPNELYNISWLLKQKMANVEKPYIKPKEMIKSNEGKYIEIPYVKIKEKFVIPKQFKIQIAIKILNKIFKASMLVSFVLIIFSSIFKPSQTVLITIGSVFIISLFLFLLIKVLIVIANILKFIGQIIGKWIKDLINDFKDLFKK